MKQHEPVHDIQTFSAHSIEKIFGGKFSSATDIQLLWKGRESFTTIFDAVKNAVRLICLEFYIFRNDETGTELAELLKQKSREGVKVYILYDHFGSLGTPRSFWKDMRRAGIKIRASRPFKWTSPFHYVHRDHKKLLIIDYKKAFTGGLNIANEYRGFHLRLKWKGWRDTGVMLEGPIVMELLNIFKKAWYTWGGEPIEIAECGVQSAECKRLNTELKSEFIIQNSEFPKGIPIIPIIASSSKGRRKMRRLLYYSINRSQKNISMTTAYFTPSKRLIETLENAVKRGVRVRLLVPGKSDVLAASYAGRAFFTRLLNAGAEIYLYGGEILHAKSYIFDDCWSIIGSANLDFQSLRYNDEGNVGILDADFAATINNIFEEDLKHSIRMNAEEWHKRSLSEKLLEHFFALFRRRL